MRMGFDLYTFQSTPSTRRETIEAADFRKRICISIHSLHTEGDGTACTNATTICDFNPLPPHGGRPEGEHSIGKWEEISIHSLHTEGDRFGYQRFAESAYFNPLPPHGGRPHTASLLTRLLTFQSTPSTRRETRINDQLLTFLLFQSTPSTRRETNLYNLYAQDLPFQSTPSTRRET